MASSYSSEFELTSYSQQPSSVVPADLEVLQNEPIQQPNNDEGFSLPPTDGGKDAWLFLFACFMLEALIWGTFAHCSLFRLGHAHLHTGFPASYGVFQDYYTTHEPFAGSSNIAVVGTCAMVCAWRVGSALTSYTDRYTRVSCTWTLPSVRKTCSRIARKTHTKLVPTI